MTTQIEILASLGLESIIKASEVAESVEGVNSVLDQTTPYRPELDDLISLHNIIYKTSRTTILEFGCGWSSLLFAASLRLLEDEIGVLDGYRRNNPYECHSLDNDEKYIEMSSSRIDSSLKKYVNFYFSEVNMVDWNGRIATAYKTLPLVSPDFIYLDGPGQFNVGGEVNAWSTRHKDMMPMVCDVLKIEHFLTPKTIIVVDGRAANSRFMKCNLQRNWQYKYCSRRDQHFFVLEEPPLGKHSEKIINEVYFRNGKWSIDDL